MPSAAHSRTDPVALATTLHALGWMVFANAAGVWMSVCLLWPRLGDLSAPLTFGRWAPVHLNAQLYGWSSLPLVGLLLALYLPEGKCRGWAPAALTAWSAALAFACVAWLAGDTGGKLFMDWRGASRIVFPLALLTLAAALSAGLRAGWTAWSPIQRGWRTLLLALLLTVPVLLAWAADASLYPPVNPHSGGATGSSLVGSTLVLVAILFFSPQCLRLAPKGRAAVWMGWLPWLLALHFVFYLFMKHGDASHHEAGQRLGLFTLLIWPPLLLARLRRFAWPAPTLRWMLALAAWGFILTLTACLMFLPGWLEKTKFTNAFVAHTHMAMAGMLTSFLMVILISIRPGGATLVLGDVKPFALWQGGCLLHVVSLFAAGSLEARWPGVLFHSSRPVDSLYLLRMIAGVAMLAASVWWARAVYPEERNVAALEAAS